MPEWLQYMLMALGPTLGGMVGRRPAQPTQITQATEQGFAPRKFPGIAQSILGQMAKAGQPRRTRTITTATQPTEAMDMGSLILMLYMMLSGEGGLFGEGKPRTTLGETALPPARLGGETVLSQAPSEFMPTEYPWKF